MVRFLRRIPIWVWLFVATSQILNIVGAISLFSWPNEEIFRYPHQEAYGLLIGAGVLLPLSIFLAIWRWRAGPVLPNSQ
jgi:hypothetical protein